MSKNRDTKNLIVGLDIGTSKVVALVVFTAMVAMLLAAPPGQVPWTLLLAATVGIALAGASAAAFNHVADRNIDAVMDRTRGRPLPSGTVTVGSATLFATLLGSAALALIWFAVNPLTALLTLFTLIGYAVIYPRYLKWIGPQNIVLSGASRAAPALLAWRAVTGPWPWPRPGSVPTRMWISWWRAFPLATLSALAKLRSRRSPSLPWTLSDWKRAIPSGGRYFCGRGLPFESGGGA